MTVRRLEALERLCELQAVMNSGNPWKVHLIWDAAAKVSSVSFTYKLLKGPTLVTHLPKILSQFHQSQRFLLCNSPADHLVVYVILCTIHVDPYRREICWRVFKSSIGSKEQTLCGWLAGQLDGQTGETCVFQAEIARTWEQSQSVIGMKYIPREDLFVYALTLREDFQ